LILKKAIFYAAGVAALAAAASVCVVALAFALHAAVAPYVGPAWASAIVALAAAALIGVLAAVLFSAGKGPKKSRKGHEPRDLTARLFELARDKPWIAAGAVAAAAAVVLKNPKITAAVLSAVMAGRASKK
jgi:hypothetical protein